MAEIYTIRVVYKSGYTHEFDVYSFEMDGSGVRWDAVTHQNQPIKIGVDNIESVWQVGVRI